MRLRPISSGAEAAIWISLAAVAATVTLIASVDHEVEGLALLSGVISFFGSIIGTIVAAIALFDGASRRVSACALVLAGSVVALWLLLFLVLVSSNGLRGLS